jgi:predicted transcriptional regulator
MDKIFSARIDEAVVQRLSLLARRLRTSKKDIIERAITDFALRLDSQDEIDELKETCGAWHRDETPEELHADIRRAFRDSMERHHS